MQEVCTNNVHATSILKRQIRQGIMTVRYMQIKELKEYSRQSYEQIAVLIKQLSERCVFSEKKLQQFLISHALVQSKCKLDEGNERSSFPLRLKNEGGMIEIASSLVNVATISTYSAVSLKTMLT